MKTTTLSLNRESCVALKQNIYTVTVGYKDSIIMFTVHERITVKL